MHHDRLAVEREADIELDQVGSGALLARRIADRAFSTAPGVSARWATISGRFTRSGSSLRVRQRCHRWRCSSPVDAPNSPVMAGFWPLNKAKSNTSDGTRKSAPMP